MRTLSLLCVAVLAFLVLTACQTNRPSVIAYEDLPEGDAAQGEILFSQVINNAPSCISCHHEGANPAAVPELTGYGEIAGTRVEGQDAHEYTFYSIVEPGRFIVPGYGNAMYNQYDRRLTPQQIADLIAYMLTL